MFEAFWWFYSLFVEFALLLLANPVSNLGCYNGFCTVWLQPVTVWSSLSGLILGITAFHVFASVHYN